MTDKALTVYIAGPITGDPEYREKFEAADCALRERGLAVFNPAAILRPLDVKGVDYDTILECCLNIVIRCDAIALLPGWPRSNGARAEMDRYVNSRPADDCVIFELNMYPDPTVPKKYSTITTRFDGLSAWQEEQQP